MQNLAQTSVVQRAWHKHHSPTLHGWVYDLCSGYLKEIALMPPGSKIEEIYSFQYPDEPAI